jgi:MFS family permease
VSAQAERHEFYPLYLARFANSFGAVTLLTLLPTYIGLWEPSGLVVGLFTTALTIASTAAVFPISWAGDRFDKRTVLLVALGLSAVTYVAFGLVDSSLQFIGARFLQGFALVGTGMISLAVVGELAGGGTRAKYIGQANAWRMAAGVIAPLGVGALYARYGFGGVYPLLVGVLLVAAVGVWLFIDPDETTVTGFALADLAVNQRILTLTSFRAQYAVAVTLIRTWVPIYAGVAAARGGLALSAFAVGATITAEKVTNMIGQPLTGRISDRYGRSLFVFAGGTA